MGAQAAVVSGVGVLHAGLAFRAVVSGAGKVFVIGPRYPKAYAEVEFGGATTKVLMFTWSPSEQATYSFELYHPDAQQMVAAVYDAAGSDPWYEATLLEGLIGETLRWRYRVDGGTWADWVFFTLVNPVTMAISSPSPGALAVTAPTVVLDWDDGRTGAVPLTQQFRIVDTTTGDVTADSGVLPWSGTYDPPPGALDASKEYRIEAEVHSDRGLTYEHEVVVTTPAGPAEVHVEPPDVSNYEATHQVTFDYWVDAVEPNWVANYIFRRRAGTIPWTLLERSEVPFPGPGIGNALTHVDEPYANIEWEYNVRQAVDNA